MASDEQRDEEEETFGGADGVREEEGGGEVESSFRKLTSNDDELSPSFPSLAPPSSLPLIKSLDSLIAWSLFQNQDGAN